MRMSNIVTTMKDYRVIAAVLIVIASACTTYAALAQFGFSEVHAQAASESEPNVGSDDGEIPHQKSEPHTTQPQLSIHEPTPPVAPRVASSAGDTAAEAQKNVTDNQTQARAEVEATSRRADSTPSPAIESQFSASGCRSTGTVVLQHGEKKVSWQEYAVQSQGNRGDCVRSIQLKLNTYCSDQLVVDGEFGSRTSIAVRAYQEYFRSIPGLSVNGAAIHVDGIVGPQTYALMQEFAAQGSFLQCH